MGEAEALVGCRITRSTEEEDTVVEQDIQIMVIMGPKDTGYRRGMLVVGGQRLLLSTVTVEYATLSGTVEQALQI